MVNRHRAAALLLCAALFPGACTLAAAETTAQLPEKAQSIRTDELFASGTVSFTDDPEAIEKAAASVVKLEVYDAQDHKIGSGSGFALGTPAVLVTAAHVIVNMDHMTAWQDDGTSFQIKYALAADTDADLAVCPLTEDIELPGLLSGSDRPKRGEDILVISSQFGLTNLVSKGTLCGYWNSEEADWLLFSAPVSGGSSGGPLFNGAGEVVGIVTGTYEKGQNLNLAAPVEKALALME